MTFSELNLDESIQRAIAESNYTAPTPIQAAAIPHLLEGRDLMGCAQTGTGKTAAFALPILQHLCNKSQAPVTISPRVLVLSPTRELALQISESFATYGRHVRFRQAAVFGGVNQNPQVKALKRGVHVLTATPGRLLDLTEQGYVRFDRVEIFVLDEADRMLDMGFLPDLKRIIAMLPERRQTLFFSATLPEEAAKLSERLLTDPVRVEVARQSSTVAAIDQRVMFVEPGNKRALLDEVLQKPDVGRTLVFTRTKRGADKLALQLSKNGIRTDSLHGNKSQNARNRALDAFRNGKLQVLVATDLAARGIDVDGITHVINYDMPFEAESYVHRIGRTGRAGACGVALSFCDASERGSLRAIEKLICTSIKVSTEHSYHSSMAEMPARKPGQRSRRPQRHFRSSFQKPGKRKFAKRGAAK